MLTPERTTSVDDDRYPRQAVCRRRERTRRYERLTGLAQTDLAWQTAGTLGTWYRRWKQQTVQEVDLQRMLFPWHAPEADGASVPEVMQ
ncbi:plasmid SOS inhibition protein A [Salmonella enterica]|nr:plasmid SOS inhibition protein A [Salmonella enterica]